MQSFNVRKYILLFSIEFEDFIYCRLASIMVFDILDATGNLLLKQIDENIALCVRNTLLIEIGLNLLVYKNERNV